MFSENQNLAVAQTELDFVFYQEFDLVDPRTVWPLLRATNESVFKVMRTSRAGEILEVYAGVETFQKKAEGAVINATVPRVGNKKTMYVDTYAERIVISKEFFDDNMHGVWEQSVRDLARAARETQDIRATEIFRAGFTTQFTADGTPWFGTHTTLKGATVVNFATGVGSALSTTSLKAAVRALQTQINQAGRISGGQPRTLVVPPALFDTAVVITESALMPGSGNNDINVYRNNYGIDIMVSPYLGTEFSGAVAAGYTDGSDTAWFLLTANHSIKRVIRQDIQTFLRPYTETDNLSYTYSCFYRETVDVLDYSGSYGAVGV
jgi:phage major head subunit gpT-like protein